jgi:L-asparaginase
MSGAARAAGRVLAALGLVTALLAPTALAAQKPRVLILTTGGTIAGGQAGVDLIGAVPRIAELADITVEEIVRVGSSAITPAHWLTLARRINEVFRADPGLTGVVVTHGTDSMEETSYFLHLTVRDERPVVVTGAMRGPTAISADGPANVIAAVRTASARDARGKGVLVVLNDEIHSARDVRKTDSNRVDAFQSPEWGAIGIVDADTVLIHRSLLTRHTTGSQLELPADTLPLVAIVADYAGSDGSVVRDWVKKGASGIVVTAFANGRTSPATTAAVREVTEAGTPVVLGSRVQEGRVMGNRGEGRIIAAGDLPPHKARVLLMLALARTRDPAELRRIFETH